jgi:Uncharacterised nucleotidyltransferase
MRDTNFRAQLMFGSLHSLKSAKTGWYVGDQNAALCPEINLLLASARTSLTPLTTDRIRASSRIIKDWPVVLRSADIHGIRPLLYRSLKNTCSDIVQEAFFNDLHASVLDNTAENLFLTAELLKVLNGLKEHGIPAVPFKGPVLASWIYGDLSLRESGDLDIIIAKRNLRDALAFIESQGYRRRSGKFREVVEDPSEKAINRYHVMEHKDSGVIIDLQTSLEGPHFSFALDDYRLWNGVVSRELGQQTVLSFSAEDSLILLCVHGTKDMWSKLKWICDIAELLDREKGLNWDRVLDQARRLRARRKLFLGCLLASHLLGAHLPDDIQRKILREPKVRASARKIGGRLFESDRSRTAFERASLYFETDDTAWKRTSRALHYVALYGRVAVVPSEKDRQFLKLPSWLSSAYYLLRPLRLTAKYGKNPRLAMKELREWFTCMG